VKRGDLVKAIKFKNSIGVVMELFADLDEKDPWIRVMFTHPAETYQWVKRSGLILVKKKEEEDP
tara:strand:- start:423 stop:614 length:192 start_codon:yes stop_codon:yes gene_type:complete